MTGLSQLKKPSQWPDLSILIQLLKDCVENFSVTFDVYKKYLYKWNDSADLMSEEWKDVRLSISYITF